jgi:hypothetical protein
MAALTIGAAVMDHDRELALTLACQQADRDGEPSETVKRARAYLDFLLNTRDAEISDAARRLSETVTRVSPRD